MVYSDESQDEAAFREYGSLEAAVEAQGAIPAAEVERALTAIEENLALWRNPASPDGIPAMAVHIKTLLIHIRKDLGLEKKEVANG